ncbi:MAG: Translation initiation factor IF-2 protein [Candidatus Nomurabacteria bacterium GW2011_GWE1_32_28]|uniref:Translation initiation factor IF-2 n=1 Tax=Candidatus Nomurabacteria bacterium GW2011_GWF1_31_48 TaxID=1618767 RepID=A0A0F9YGB5_9BACT|nr:MAG: Translation initiation factor IF-2 protein [Candidatus Nomurabacteria bacterium GW2011_GWF2_30_133]KKP28901.1 MAG: Translation initiation factor IF-2 protein [Candidatus Nomurabacteria bacterium GW2011_GWE2_31_40]KKP30639.1 MAG: Translation initiation factor IF-2 protein [Candidatus Nomurabacteria bacterium GW2011_GWF1_31_48]KKP35157.1 MAG: Translation initiation factor IF-2 protein [Candidatus Nomurabacteria bacterium GW2011_GWE1_32_28]HAS80467.1 translation initiation factor IF-2 [Can
MEKINENKNIERSPVVVIMGHIDHGKSTLLDYIRETNIVEKEIGGITQNTSAYEVIHTQTDTKQKKKITFIDTPGHESFSKMRERGCQIADIAILIVSAEDGVKTQTIEAWKTIVENKIPCIVAINKIDKENANIEKTKTELAENEIYLENYGGKIPFVEISAKTGKGIDDLLSLINILAEMENFVGDREENASGFILEANLDPKRGIVATIIIKNGTLLKGMTIVVEDSTCSTNIMENFLGEKISEASFSSPARLIGFSKIPKIGAEFKSFKNKKDVEKYINDWEKDKISNNKQDKQKQDNSFLQTDTKIIPIILKADISGSLEAIEKEINKINYEFNATVSKNAKFKIIQKGVGPIGESDIKTISGSENILVIGFNVKIDKSAIELAEKRGITISFFDIIYKMTEWLEAEMEERRPKIETVETIGKAKILRVFNKSKERQILGGKTIEGRIVLNKTVKIMRREFEIGRGKIVNLEKSKVKVKEVEEGAEFGMMIESKMEIVEGDIIESFNVTQK